ncbi:MAG: HD-GYP domain-containing protein [Planctomycetota bacterium]|jgi:HD-GYP domain-containing protein (c-di-GMP phosphodiesterase class II)
MLDTISKTLTSSQLRDLERFGRKVNRFGVNFAVCTADGRLILLCDDGNCKFDTDGNLSNTISKSNLEQLTKTAIQVLEHDRGQKSAAPVEDVYRLGEHNRFFAAVLESQGQKVAAALIFPADDEQEYLAEMLALLTENFRTVSTTESQIEKVSTELGQVYEELVLLHKLSTNMKVAELDANFMQMACDNLTDIVDVEGIAILLEKKVEDERQLVLAAGSGLLDMDEQMAAVLHSRLVEQLSKGKEALLDSEVDSPFEFEWAEHIKNIIAVPLFGKNKTGYTSVDKTQSENSIIGLMVAINRIDKPDFDSTDVKLFNSVANSCAVFVENGTLFRDLKELFIGSLKALTSSIDAKDQYTRGHSERVAFISRWIAERIAEKELLEEEQIHKVYLAGLLHDIGKVGIDESVLRKEGRLTEKEFDHIKAHPSIGAGILREIKQMRDIVPGVLYHHERVDGKGYPEGLSGDQIPLIGKIVGLADSFDAMTSKRTYRGALTLEQTLQEIESNLGTQFDEKVGKLFIKSNVYQLWDVIQSGFSEIYGSSALSEYDTVAVETLL